MSQEYKLSLFKLTPFQFNTKIKYLFSSKDLPSKLFKVFGKGNTFKLRDDLLFPFEQFCHRKLNPFDILGRNINWLHNIFPYESFLTKMKFLHLKTGLLKYFIHSSPWGEKPKDA